MGYYTRYKLIEPKRPTLEELKMLVQIQPDYFPDIRFAEELWNGDMDEMKWYDYEQDMLQLSREFPDVLYVLHAEGEDGERWRTYFKGGKSQTVEAKIIFDEFDESKLK